MGVPAKEGRKGRGPEKAGAGHAEGLGGLA